jgi:hypothetical protein
MTYFSCVKASNWYNVGMGTLLFDDTAELCDDSVPIVQ